MLKYLLEGADEMALIIEQVLAVLAFSNQTLARSLTDAR